MKNILKYTHVAIKVIFIRNSESKNAWLVTSLEQIRAWKMLHEDTCLKRTLEESDCRIWRCGRPDYGAWSPSPTGLSKRSVKTRVSWVPGCIIQASWWLLMCSFCSVQYLAMQVSLVAARNLARLQKKRLPETGFPGLVLMHKLSLKERWWGSLAFSLPEMEEAPRRKKKKKLKIWYQNLKLSLQHDREFENKASAPADHSDPPLVY